MITDTPVLTDGGRMRYHESLQDPHGWVRFRLSDIRCHNFKIIKISIAVKLFVILLNKTNNY